MAFKAVIFDFWGTLFKPVIPVKAYLRERVRSLWFEIKLYGLDITLREIEEAYIANRREVDEVRRETGREVSLLEEVKGLLRKLTLGDSLLLPLMRAYLKPFQRELRPVEGARVTLSRLKSSGYSIGLLSNTFWSYANKALLTRYGLIKYFDSLKFSDEIGWRKPRAEAFKEVLKDLKVEPSEALMVGDSEEDEEGAENLGMKFFKVAGVGGEEPKVEEVLKILRCR